MGLMGTSPQRLGDDVSRLDMALREFDGNATDFLDGPANQERFLVRKRGSVFLSGTALAW